jgi:hypothetical protein
MPRYSKMVYHQKGPRSITLPLRHIKATVRTRKTGKESAFFHKKTREIFWQAVSGNRHFRPHIAAKNKTRTFSTTRKFARIPLSGWQGIMAKPANNYDKAHSCLWLIAIRYGMAPFEVDNGSAGYAGMTTVRPHEDVPDSTRDNTTKHSPRKQRRGRSARNRVLWKRKHM